jgi:putative transposase
MNFKNKREIMANTYHKMYAHTVFAVKYRKAMIQPEWRKDLHAVLGNLINQAGAKTLIVNGISDHVHCFFSVKPDHSVSQIMKSVKAKSSKWINEQGITRVRFEWQKGFGSFTYAESQINRVYWYVSNQEEHHRKITFREEYISLLKLFKVDFDERYIFQEPV